jgi:hypothetical protein
LGLLPAPGPLAGGESEEIMADNNMIERTDMWKNRSHRNLVEEIYILRHLLIDEKRKGAETLWVERLIHMGLVFLILFLIIISALKDASRAIQWLVIILFIFAGLLVYLKNNRHYEQTIKSIREFESSNWERPWT